MYIVHIVSWKGSRFIGRVKCYYTCMLKNRNTKCCHLKHAVYIIMITAQHVFHRRNVQGRITVNMEELFLIIPMRMTLVNPCSFQFLQQSIYQFLERNLPKKLVFVATCTISLSPIHYLTCITSNYYVHVHVLIDYHDCRDYIHCTCTVQGL